jgi:hypothetical protein
MINSLEFTEENEILKEWKEENSNALFENFLNDPMFSNNVENNKKRKVSEKEYTLSTLKEKIRNKKHTYEEIYDNKIESSLQVKFIDNQVLNIPKMNTTSNFDWYIYIQRKLNLGRIKWEHFKYFCEKQFSLKIPSFFQLSEYKENKWDFGINTINDEDSNN